MRLISILFKRFSVLLLLLYVPLAATQPTTIPSPSSGTIVRIDSLASQYVPSRPIDVWLPDGYDTTIEYETLYMHDGQMLFDSNITWNGQEWQVDDVAQRLINSGSVRPFIVVGIWNSGATRYTEYLPTKAFTRLNETQRQIALDKAIKQKKITTELPIAFTADNYLAFISKELIPYIEQHFSVKKGPEYRFIMGSSMGGLISWYALTEYPDQFAAAACMSTHWPGMNDVENPYPEAFKQTLKEGLARLNGHRLYFDLGDQTLDALYPPLQQDIDDMLRQNYPSELWESHTFPGAKHDERSWAARLAQPLQFLFARR